MDPQNNPNKEIFANCYPVKIIGAVAVEPWELGLEEIRQSLLKHYASGNRGLDLCCGTGLYTHHKDLNLKSIVGLDFTMEFLQVLIQDFQEGGKQIPVNLVLGDAMELPFVTGGFQMLWSFRSLYTLPNFGNMVQEISRVLEPGGFGVLELLNPRSLTFAISKSFHKRAGWAKAFGLKEQELNDLLQKSGLEAVEWKRFQIFPMFGAPPKQYSWLLVGHPGWRVLMGKSFRGKMLDEWICRLPFFKSFAGRWLLVVRKKLV